jgi:MFS family permease
LGQISDGIFQSALASYVLFSPERQPSAVAAAASFAVTLLPYSLIAPFTGTFLDRYSRVRVILSSNLIRFVLLLLIAFLLTHHSTGIALTLLVLASFGLGRLILAGLSAGLPLVVSPKNLVSLNALLVTGGTIGIVIGGGVGLGFKSLLDKHLTSDSSGAIVVLVAALAYGVCALLASRWNKSSIGPVKHLKDKGLLAGFIEMKEGFLFLKSHSELMRGALAVAITRGGQTALVLMGLLLERNTFNSPTQPDKGLQAFGFALAIAGIGIGLGALFTPFAVERFGRHRWMRIALIAPTPFLTLIIIFIKPWSLIVTALVLGGFGQAVKVTNDALLQNKTPDIFRGRTFAFYDIAVNTALVIGALLAAWVLPTSGISTLLPIVIAIFYLLTVAFILNKSRFTHGA